MPVIGCLWVATEADVKPTKYELVINFLEDGERTWPHGSATLLVQTDEVIE
jgi:hypothetical protein